MKIKISYPNELSNVCRKADCSLFEHEFSIDFKSKSQAEKFFLEYIKEYFHITYEEV